jgi:carbon starvation protein CstA
VGAGGQGPGEREQAISLLVVGLVLALATPFLLPAGVLAIVVAVMLVRRGRNGYALAVLLPAVFALVFIGLALLDR